VRQRLRRYLPYAFVVIALAAAFYAVSKNGHSLRHALDQLGTGSIIASTMFGALAVYATFLMWREALRGLGVPVPILVGSRVFFVSQLGKYLPGSVWPVVAQMEFGRRTGTGRRTMLAANGLITALSLAVGLIIAAISLPFASAHALRQFWWALACLPFLLALLHPRVIPGLLNWVSRRLGRGEMDESLTWGTTLKCVGWAALSWLLFGMHMYLLVRGVGVHGWHTIPASLGGFALAVCAGVLFIPAPAGALVRDSVLVAALATSMSATTALALSLVSRVLLIVVDVGLAAVFGPRLRWPGRPPSPALRTERLQPDVDAGT
jgi:hypothetical protein